jgi:hypothetical protein
MLALSRVPQCILSHVPAALLAGSSRHRCMAASSSRTLDELQQSLQQAIAAVAAYQAAHRHVAGLDKLARRVRGDLNASRGSHLPDGVVPDPGLLQVGVSGRGGAGAAGGSSRWLPCWRASCS